ncbi:MAG: copper amine oxidase N-terminal domain-containing protein [Fimbriimonadales bacterium]|nr:copper amine oxidase N-terminal domain-containing protein [Fimbriimonadales bacterium]
MLNAVYTQPPVELDGALLEWQDVGALIGKAYPPALPDAREDAVDEGAIEGRWRTWSKPYLQRLGYLNPSTGVRGAPTDSELDDWLPSALTFTLTLPPHATRRLILRYTVRSNTFYDPEALGDGLVQGDHLNYLFAPNGLAKGVPVRVRVAVAPNRAVRMEPALPRVGVRNGYTVYEARLQRPDQILIVGGTPRELRSFYLRGEEKFLDYLDPGALLYDRAVQQLGDDYYAPARWLTECGIRLSAQANRYHVQAGAVSLQFTLGARQAVLSGAPITLSAPPRVIDGELLLPLREVLFLMYHHWYAKQRPPERERMSLSPEEPILPPPPLEAIQIYRHPESAVVAFTIQRR